MKEIAINTQEDLDSYAQEIQEKSIPNKNDAEDPVLPPGPDDPVLFASSLVVSGDRITEIPPALFESRHLRRLTISNTRITFLPDLFDRLSGTLLELICPSSRLLNSLPPSIGSLQNLTKIDFQDTPLTIFPNDIFKCRNLIEVVFSGCSFVNIPEGFSALKSMQKLVLRGCELSDLPYEMVTCNIRNLDISDNQFVHVPQCIPRMPQIHWVNLSTRGTRTISQQEEAIMKQLYATIAWSF